MFLFHISEFSTSHIVSISLFVGCNKCFTFHGKLSPLLPCLLASLMKRAIANDQLKRQQKLQFS